MTDNKTSRDTERLRDCGEAFEATFNKAIKRSGKTDENCRFHDVGALKGFVLPIWQAAWDAKPAGDLGPVREALVSCRIFLGEEIPCWLEEDIISSIKHLDTITGVKP